MYYDVHCLNRVIKPLARGCQYTREHYYAVGKFFFPTAVTFYNDHATDLICSLKMIVSAFILLYYALFCI